MTCDDSWSICSALGDCDVPAPVPVGRSRLRRQSCGVAARKWWGPEAQGRRTRGATEAFHHISPGFLGFQKLGDTLILCLFVKSLWWGKWWNMNGPWWTTFNFMDSQLFYRRMSAVMPVFCASSVSCRLGVVVHVCLYSHCLFSDTQIL